jgi:hypothetical protein
MSRSDWLTEHAKLICDDLAKRTGSLKIVLSAGVIALSKLSAEEREKMIAEANGLGLEPLNKPEEQFRRRVLQIVEESKALGRPNKSARQTKNPKSG